MATLVKKFGGSSVATPEKMHGIVDRILRERQPDDRIVLVVSAMGDHTDDLLTLAAKVNPEMPKRELDMLLATGIGFAMANAPEEVRRQIRNVTLSNDQEGVLAGLRQLNF